MQTGPVTEIFPRGPDRAHGLAAGIERRICGSGQSNGGRPTRRAQGGGTGKKDLDRRRFLKIAGTSMGVGALYTVFPRLAGSAEAAQAARPLRPKNGEEATPVNLAQLSDAHGAV